MTPRTLPERFLVAFSFAGEHRALVRAIAEAVENELGRSTVFLDEWFEHYIAGSDADLRLQDIYERRCDLAVVCVSERYGGKPWTLAEHEVIRSRLMKARALDQRYQLGVLPIRVGDGDIKGLPFNAIVPDVRSRAPEESARLIIDRLRLLTPELHDQSARPQATEVERGTAVPEQDILRLVDISIDEAIFNYPFLEHSEEEEFDPDGPIDIDPDDFIEYRKWWPVLDVKVRNAGRETAFAKRAEFHVMRVARFGNPLDCWRSQVPVSYEYDVQLSPSITEGAVISINISHAIQPGDVDRFAFRISQSGADVDSPVWYYLRLTLIYNEDDRRCASHPILLSVPTDVRKQGQTGTPGFRNAVIDQNLTLFSEFSELPGQKSPTIVQLVRRRSSRATD